MLVQIPLCAQLLLPRRVHLCAAHTALRGLRLGRLRGLLLCLLENRLMSHSGVLLVYGLLIRRLLLIVLLIRELLVRRLVASRLLRRIRLIPRILRVRLLRPARRLASAVEEIVIRRLYRVFQAA